MKEVLELAKQVSEAPDEASALLSQFVEEHTFPIVDEDTATFFFWDRETPPESVVLIHWVFGLESRQTFIPLEGTDAWYLPLELPSRARVEYKLEVVRNDQRQWIRDPLNDRRAFDPFGSNSVCPMQGYREPLWVEEDADSRQGRLECLPIRSQVFGELREVRVYTPAEYRATKRYPLLICHDGGDYLRFARMGTILDNLVHRREVAPLVVIFTDGGERNIEYGANPKQAKFLVEEVIPTIRRRYGISEDAADIGCMGASFGAVASLYAACEYPGVFGRLLLQSGSFAFTDVGSHDRGPLFDPVVEFVNTFRGDPAQIERGESGRQPVRIFLSCGTFESLIYYNRSLLPRLRRSGLEVQYRESPDGHNWINWRNRLRDGLSWLFPGRLWMYYE